MVVLFTFSERSRLVNMKKQLIVIWHHQLYCTEHIKIRLIGTVTLLQRLHKMRVKRDVI